MPAGEELDLVRDPEVSRRERREAETAEARTGEFQESACAVAGVDWRGKLLAVRESKSKIKRQKSKIKNNPSCHSLDWRCA